MLEVRPGLLLGSMGDALAVFTRVPSVVKQYHVTHVLSICNQPPEWMDPTTAPEQSTTSDGTETDSEKEDDEEEESSGATKETEHKEGTEEEEREQERREGVVKKPGRQHQKRKRKICGVELPKHKKFIEVADMSTSDLLHHFESCCQFIKEGRERGTVLVHCEHGVSRSVTVLLAYQMWSERRSLKVLYQELQERKPEIRPNPGFMDQLRLWEEMGCRIREDNKKYRAYRLQCKAREIEATGYIEEMKMAPDPGVTSVDATVYFRCRKCRQLLFTDSDVLQHELGEGRVSFQRHKGRRRENRRVQVGGIQNTDKEEERTSQEVEQNGGEGKREEEEVTSSQLSHKETEETISMSKKGDDEKNIIEEVILGGNPDCHLSPPDTTASLTSTDMSVMRQEIAAIVGQRATYPLSSSATCTSYFIEPVAWMGEALLGHMDGKILCPKCNSRLGSFSWKGQQCSCGRRLTPAFQVHKSKIDDVKTLKKRKNFQTDR